MMPPRIPPTQPPQPPAQGGGQGGGLPPQIMQILQALIEAGIVDPRGVRLPGGGGGQPEPDGDEGGPPTMAGMLQAGTSGY